MTTTVATAPPTTARSSTDLRRSHRWFVALLMPIGPAAVAVLRFVLPSSTTDDSSGLVTEIAANLGAQSLVLSLALVALFTLVPGAFGVLRLVGRRDPKLTAVAGLLLIPGYLGLFGGLAPDLIAYVGVKDGMAQSDVVHMMDLAGTAIWPTIALTVFVVGHILGTVLLGIAMFRSRVVARGWAVAMAISQPLHLLAAMTGNHPLDLFAWGMTTLAMAAAAVALIRLPDDEWDLPPATT